MSTSAPPPVANTAAKTPSTPAPPRRWWLKRLTAAFVLFLLALAGLRWWWGCVADGRLQARIAEYRAAGQRVYLQDFASPPIPDSENAATFLQQAAVGVAGGLDLRDVAYPLRNGTLDLNEARSFLRANAERLRLVHEARSRAAADWGLRPTSTAVFGMLPILSPQRVLAKEVCSAALYQHALGSDAAALESLRDVLGLAQRLQNAPNFLIAYLVAISIDASALDTLEEIAPHLTVVDSERGAIRTDSPATRGQIEALIREFLDVAPFTEHWTTAVQGERICMLDTTDWLLNTPSASLSGLAGGGSRPAALAERGFIFLLAPAWKLDLLSAMRRCDTYARAAALDNWPAASRSVAPDAWDVRATGDPTMFAHLIRAMLSPSLQWALQQGYVVITFRRCAATALAIRLYELDHGRRPLTLAELVPNYLPVMPRDPFDPDDGPLRYLPNAPSPLLYSVSLNGIDDGGAFPPSNSGDYRRQDLPFFLNGDRPLRPPNPPAGGSSQPTSQPASAQALDHDGNVEDTQRNEGEHQDHPERQPP